MVDYTVVVRVRAQLGARDASIGGEENAPFVGPVEAMALPSGSLRLVDVWGTNVLLVPPGVLRAAGNLLRIEARADRRRRLTRGGRDRAGAAVECRGVARAPRATGR